MSRAPATTRPASPSSTADPTTGNPRRGSRPGRARRAPQGLPTRSGGVPRPVSRSRTVGGVRPGVRRGRNCPIVDLARRSAAAAVLRRWSSKERHPASCGEMQVQGLPGAPHENPAPGRPAAGFLHVCADQHTSHLDAVDETVLTQALSAATRHCAALVITHRLATVRHADRIVVLEDGRTVASGRTTSCSSPARRTVNGPPRTSCAASAPRAGGPDPPSRRAASTGGAAGSRRHCPGPVPTHSRTAASHRSTAACGSSAYEPSPNSSKVIQPS